MLDGQQGVFCIAVDEMITGVRADIERMKRRTVDEIGQVVRTRHVCGGAARIAGTRIPVATVVALHGDWLSQSRILREYPTLRPADVKAAIAFGAGRKKRRAG